MIEQIRKNLYLKYECATRDKLIKKLNALHRKKEKLENQRRKAREFVDAKINIIQNILIRLD